MQKCRKFFFFEAVRSVNGLLHDFSYHRIAATFVSLIPGCTKSEIPTFQKEKPKLTISKNSKKQKDKQHARKF